MSKKRQLKETSSGKGVRYAEEKVSLNFFKNSALDIFLF